MTDELWLSLCTLSSLFINRQLSIRGTLICSPHMFLFCRLVRGSHENRRRRFMTTDPSTPTGSKVTPPTHPPGGTIPSPRVEKSPPHVCTCMVGSLSDVVTGNSYLLFSQFSRSHSLLSLLSILGNTHITRSHRVYRLLPLLQLRGHRLRLPQVSTAKKEIPRSFERFSPMFRYPPLLQPSSTPSAPPNFSPKAASVGENVEPSCLLGRRAAGLNQFGRAILPVVHDTFTRLHQQTWLSSPFFPLAGGCSRRRRLPSALTVDDTAEPPPSRLLPSP
jgi:hypothetical protein